MEIAGVGVNLGLGAGLALVFYALCGMYESELLYYRCDEMFRSKTRMEPAVRKLIMACERILLVIGAACFTLLFPVPIPKFLLACVLAVVSSLPLKTQFPLPNKERRTMLFFDSVARFAMGFPPVLLVTYLTELGVPIWAPPVIAALTLHINWARYEDKRLDAHRCVKVRDKMGMLTENYGLKFTAIGGCSFFIISTLAITFIA